MARPENYQARNFSRATRELAFDRCRDADGVPRCDGCGKPVTRGTCEFDHITPFELSRYSGPSNCQVLCCGTPQSCHEVKTYTVDIPLIADNNRMRDRYINGRKQARHPLPCGRISRWSKPIHGAPVRRVAPEARHRRAMAKDRTKTLAAKFAAFQRARAVMLEKVER